MRFIAFIVIAYYAPWYIWLPVGIFLLAASAAQMEQEEQRSRSKKPQQANVAPGVSYEIRWKNPDTDAGGLA